MRSPELRLVRYRAPLLERQQLPARVQRERRAGAVAVLLFLVGALAFAAAFWWSP